MTDLDTLRRALKAPVTPDLGGLHIGQIMARGRRVRRRRRILAASGAAGMAAVLAAAVIGAGHLGRPAPAPPPITGQHSGKPGKRSAHPGRDTPYGSVISTGIRDSAGELVFYAVRIHTRQLPGITFGVMGGYRAAAGRLTADVESNEFTGSDTSRGFHAVQAPTNVNGRLIPEFGYYAGPAAKITGMVNGRKIRAAQARWSVNPKIVIFWFSPRDNPAAKTITGLTAYTAAGKKLPAGHNSAGVG